MAIQTVLAVLLLAAPAEGSPNLSQRPDPVTKDNSLSAAKRKRLKPVLTAAKKDDFVPLSKMLGRDDLSQASVLQIDFLVLKETIKESNENKRYYLAKLAMYNEMGEQLSDYLSELQEAAKKLDSKQKKTVKITTRELVEADGVAVVIKGKRKHLNAAGFEREIKRVKRQRRRAKNGLTARPPRGERPSPRRLTAATKRWRRIIKASEKSLKPTLSAGNKKVESRRRR